MVDKNGLKILRFCSDLEEKSPKDKLTILLLSLMDFFLKSEQNLYIFHITSSRDTEKI